jgi:3-deoxy-manno-octulosonate cytidylyltransferase (CMP-KDO synthetase)
MKKEKIVAIIPARMGASRFPGKPLAKILDLPMIEHVRRRVNLCEAIEEVYVATCDQEIYDTVQSFGGKAIMTLPTHERCTDRVEEAARGIDADIVVLVQGDEPLFVMEVADNLLKPMLHDEQILCVNLLSTIQDQSDLTDTDIVKAVMNPEGFVIYYSRAPIPYQRVRSPIPLYRQTGLSAFRKNFLTKFSLLSQTPLEITESVDFLRMIENGYRIKGVVYEQEMIGVDQPEHIALIENVLRCDETQKKIYQRIC